MQGKLTSATTLDNLRREARRWLKALREKQAEARERFERFCPKHTATPVLRDVQHALARAHLARLPGLREVHLDGLPGVTLEGTKVFPPIVHVYYST